MKVSSKYKILWTLMVIIQGVACRGPFDLIIRHGSICDGSGSLPWQGDLAIRDGRIVDIDTFIKGRARHLINARGLTVAPGFIDLHAHLAPLSLFPDAKSMLMQGVTTAIGGPDGGSPFPLATYLDSLRRHDLGINVGYLIGHNTIRNHVMGLINRSPTNVEMRTMKSMVQEAMQSGAFGLSTGLKYVPGSYASKDEVIELAKVASESGGIYTSHLRDEGVGLIDAVAEAIEIGHSANIPIVLTHHKVMGARNWGNSKQTLSMVDAAIEQGLRVMIDQYPYTASHTSLKVVIPAWAFSQEDGATFTSRCQVPRLRDSIRRGIIANLLNDRGGTDLRRIQFAKINWKPAFVGKTLHELLLAEGIKPTIEAGADMIIDIQLHRGALCIYHVIDGADVDRIMQHPATMIASDGTVSQFGRGHPHPRSYGTFPRVLGRYVRERALLTLPEAIRKMTAAPAEAIGLVDRGKLSKGNRADITIFDPDRILDLSTFEMPHAYPTGISYVIVNGKIAVDEGGYQAIGAGQVLRNIYQFIPN